MQSAGSLKNAAWEQLSGNWASAVVFTLVYMIIGVFVTTAESQIWGFTLLSILLIVPMQYSYVIAFLDNKRTGSEMNIKKLFVGFDDYVRILGTYILQNIYIFLWSLLLIIPGIIKSISYSQTYYILHDNPSLSPDAAIERSMEMMKGHKMEYFWLVLTFIGWIILMIITMGIATLWVTPYMIATFAQFYENLKEEYEKGKIA